jgi:hypothetical protein
VHTFYCGDSQLLLSCLRCFTLPLLWSYCVLANWSVYCACPTAETLLSTIALVVQAPAPPCVSVILFPPYAGGSAPYLLTGYSSSTSLLRGALLPCSAASLVDLLPLRLITLVPHNLSTISYKNLVCCPFCSNCLPICTGNCSLR